MAAKRSLEEFTTSFITQPKKSARVDGVLKSLSPMKKSRKDNSYFVGHLTDGSTDVRIVGFDQNQQTLLNDSFQKRQPVMLEGCEIGQSSASNQMQIIIKSSTCIQESPTKFKLDDIAFQEPRTEDVNIVMIPDIQDGTKINITGKIVCVNPPVQFASGKTKQDVKIADDTGVTTLRLWEEDVNTLPEGKSYTLWNMTVQSFNNRKYVSKSWGDGTITEVADVKDVIAIDEVHQKLENAEIVAVPFFQVYHFCMVCKEKAKMTIYDNNILGRCNKCEALQRLDHCSSQTYATLTLQNEQATCTLQASTSVLLSIANPLTEEALLVPQHLDVTYNEENQMLKVEQTTAQTD